MNRNMDDELSYDELNEMEERRITAMDEAGIDEKQVLHDSNEHLETWQSYFNENTVRGKDDMNFVLRDQWTAVERSEFTRLFKPAMTFNKLYDPTKKIVGEQRKNKPDLIVRSLTGKASQEQINLRADLVRTIAYQSQNDLIYQNAFKSALLMGYGAFEVGIEYENPRSFNQVIRYKMILDAARCSFDPSSIKPHKGDGNWCSKILTMRKNQFFATYPYITNPISYPDPYQLLDYQWQSQDTIAIAQYSEKKWFPLIIYKLSNGQVVDQQQWKDMQKDIKRQKELGAESLEVGGIIEREIPRIVNERQTQDYRIMQYQLIQNQIIDFSEWPSKQLPIIFVDGDSNWIEGRQYTKSFIHEARDAQKCVNYFNSEIAAEVKNRRREQWLATPDNIIGYEQQWRNPELQMGALMAKPDPKTGAMPIKQPPWDLSPALMANAQRATQDISEILGFSESEELAGRDISGKARRERKLEGGMSAYVFFDNLNQAVEQGGRVVNDLLPHIIGDEERHMVVTKKDGKSSNVVLNRRTGDDEVENEIKGGEFDVEIDTGPSFAVQQEIALEFMTQAMAANPEVFPLIADLYAAQLDVQFMPQIKERLKTLVPPEILAKEDGTPPPPPKPNPQQIAMQAEIQNKQAQIQIKAQELQLKQQQMEIDKAKLTLEAQKAENDAKLNIFDHQSDLAQAVARHHLDKEKHDGDFSAKIAGILSDLHKHNNPQQKAS